MFFKSELTVKRLDINEIIYQLIFNPELIPIDELMLASIIINAINKNDKKIEKIEKEYGIPRSKMYDFVKKILNKGIIGKGGIDPPMFASIWTIAYYRGLRDSPYWWCRGGAIGKKFTEPLCTGPNLTYHGRGIALNPWSLDNIGDLDTLISSDEVHKSGTIGTGSFSFSRRITSEYVTFAASFTGASDTTVRSVIVVIITGPGQKYESCKPEYPAPTGTCHSSYYCVVVLPLWGFDVNFNVQKDIGYSVTVKLSI